MQVNKFVSFWIKLTIGSTTTVGSGLYQITLPVTPFATHPVHFDIVSPTPPPERSTEASRASSRHRRR
jgi:hypothetical protein